MVIIIAVNLATNLAARTTGAPAADAPGSDPS
jgi:hypothetical protein